MDIAPGGFYMQIHSIVLTTLVHSINTKLNNIDNVVTIETDSYHNIFWWFSVYKKIFSMRLFT